MFIYVLIAVLAGFGIHVALERERTTGRVGEMAFLAMSLISLLAIRFRGTYLIENGMMGSTWSVGRWLSRRVTHQRHE